MLSFVKPYLSYFEKPLSISGLQYTIFGLFGAFIYTFSFLIWDISANGSSLILYLRAFAAFLCLLLVFKADWPQFLEGYFSYFWNFSLLYALVFLPTFIFLENSSSPGWLINMLFSLFLLLILTDWSRSIFLVSIGSFAAWTAFFIIHPFSNHAQDTNIFIILMYTYLFCFTINIGFIRTKESMERKKMETLQTFGSTIIHEISTPISAILIDASTIKKQANKILEGNMLLLEQRSDILNACNRMIQVSENLEKMARTASNTMNMLSTSLKGLSTKTAFTLFNAHHSILNAINEFPLSDKDRKNIFIDSLDDFYLFGDEYLFRHVIFNLLKNSLYFIKKAGKGSIEIQLLSHESENRILFKDTSTGIAKDILPFIFDRFYTNRPHGTGIGLYFCKLAINSFGGDIMCESVENEFTVFTLSFPQNTSHIYKVK